MERNILAETRATKSRGWLSFCVNCISLWNYGAIFLATIKAWDRWTSFHGDGPFWSVPEPPRSNRSELCIYIYKYVCIKRYLFITIIPASRSSLSNPSQTLRSVAHPPRWGTNTPKWWEPCDMEATGTNGRLMQQQLHTTPASPTSSSIPSALLPNNGEPKSRSNRLSTVISQQQLTLEGNNGEVVVTHCRLDWGKVRRRLPYT